MLDENSTPLLKQRLVGAAEGRDCRHRVCQQIKWLRTYITAYPLATLQWIELLIKWNRAYNWKEPFQSLTPEAKACQLTVDMCIKANCSMLVATCPMTEGAVTLAKRETTPCFAYQWTGNYLLYSDPPMGSTLKSVTRTAVSNTDKWLHHWLLAVSCVTVTALCKQPASKWSDWPINNRNLVRSARWSRPRSWRYQNPRAVGPIHLQYAPGIMGSGEQLWEQNSAFVRLCVPELSRRDESNSHVDFPCYRWGWQSCAVLSTCCSWYLEYQVYLISDDKMM